MKSKLYKRERDHKKEFYIWLKDQVEKKEGYSSELLALAKGPQRAARRFTGYVVNGLRFHTKKRDGKCTTQNSGVHLMALTTSFSSTKDKNPIVGEVSYYGAIEEIIEVDYWGALSVVLFRCIWYQKDKDCHGLTRVNFNKIYQKEDPFVLATQVQQVFYIQDCSEKNLYFVVRRLPRDYNDIEEETDPLLEEAVNADMYQELEFPINTLPDDNSWYRDDVPKRQILNTPSEVEENDENCE